MLPATGGGGNGCAPAERTEMFSLVDWLQLILGTAPLRALFPNYAGVAKALLVLFSFKPEMYL